MRDAQNKLTVFHQHLRKRHTPYNLIISHARCPMPYSPLIMIEAVIFDMDGLLIDSEPLWQQAEITIFKQVDIILIPSMCMQTKGLRIDEVVDYWYKKYPWDKLSKLQVEEAIVDKLIELIHTEGKALPGVNEAIDFVKAKNLRIALASSSSYKIINAALQKLDIADDFEIIYSAESEPLGKPHPGVYLTTSQKLGVSPQNCLALEDSLNGVLAAKSAQMKCIAIPETSELHNPKFAIADMVLESLEQLDDNIWNFINS